MQCRKRKRKSRVGSGGGGDGCAADAVAAASDEAIVRRVAVSLRLALFERGRVRSSPRLSLTRPCVVLCHTLCSAVPYRATATTGYKLRLTSGYTHHICELCPGFIYFKEEHNLNEDAGGGTPHTEGAAAAWDHAAVHEQNV